MSYRLGCLISVLGIELSIVTSISGTLLDSCVLFSVGIVTLIVNFRNLGVCAAHVIPLRKI